MLVYAYMQVELYYPVTIGPITLPYTALLLLGAALVGFLAVYVKFRSVPDSRRFVMDTLTAALAVGLGAWKLAPIVLNLSELFSDPVSLLLRPGGTAGVVAGVGAGGAVFFLRSAKHRAHLPGLIVATVTFGIAGTLAAGVGLVGSVAATEDAEPAPPFSAMTVEGEEWDLSEEDGPVVLNFWATWCAPCRAEKDVKARAHREWADEVPIISVNLTHTEQSAEAVAEFAAAHSLPYPVLLDDTGRITQQYGVRGTPTTYVIDDRGRIAFRRHGAMSWSWLDSRIRRLQ